MKSKLIGREVTITTGEYWDDGDWGIIVGYDGEYYDVMMFGDEGEIRQYGKEDFKIVKDGIAK